MFYTTDTNQHGLRHDPFKAIVSPRPIGWIGTKGRDGSRNLSPYSFFNIVSDGPKIVMFSSSGRKHSLKNAEETGVFTTSFASANLAAAVNMSSIEAAYGVDEFEIAGLATEQGRLVDAPFVAAAMAALECRVTQIMQPRDLDGMAVDSHMVFGQVVAIHIRDDAISEGRFDMKVAVPIGRLGYMDYVACNELFELFRPPKPKS